MRDKFRGARSRIRWAKESSGQFQRRAQSFFKKNPHATVVEPDADGIHERHKLKLTRPLPDSLTKSTVTSLEHLRAALDLTAAVIAAKIGTSAGDIHFPFCAKATDMKSRINSVCRNFPDEIKTLFASFQPYRGGHDLLWALNELCNGSKHRLIVPVGMTTNAMHAHKIVMTSSGTGGSYIPVPRWDSEKDEMVFAVAGKGAKFEYDLTFTFSVTFGEVDIVKGAPVQTVLRGLHSKITNIVDATEAECNRIGLFG
jgi:hypothetical protein